MGAKEGFESGEGRDARKAEAAEKGTKTGIGLRTAADWNALNTLTHETYVFRANREKSDFTNWAGDTITDEMLAKDLQEASNRAQAAKLVASRMATLSERLA